MTISETNWFLVKSQAGSWALLGISQSSPDAVLNTFDATHLNNDGKAKLSNINCHLITSDWLSMTESITGLDSRPVGPEPRGGVVVWRNVSDNRPQVLE
jgi:hypothetical protein